MDFSKLSSNDKLALYGAIAAVVGAILSLGIGLITLLAALLVGFVVLQPQVAPTVNLPGSKGSLMLLGGGVAAVFSILGMLSWMGYAFVFSGMTVIFSLVAVAGSLLMAWAGWQAFQAEGGKFQLGSSGGTSAAPPPPAPMAPPPAPMAPPPTPMAPPPAEPMGGAGDEDDESRS